MKRKNENGEYYVDYVINHSPAGTDATVWSVAVLEYLGRNGITETTPSMTMGNPDWPELRRLYNRIIGEGKQRRSVHSAPALDLKLKIGGTE